MNENIIRKIQALLAMADEQRNDSENERATALRQATAMMDKHEISMADVISAEGADALGPMGEDGYASGSSLWQCIVVQHLAGLYGCTCYRTRGASGRTYVCGREHLRTIVLSMSAYVIGSIEREYARWRVTHRGGRTAKHSFCTGATSGVGQQVREIQAARKAGETTDTGTALALVDHYRSEQALATAWRDSAHPNLGTGRAQGARDSGAHSAGRAAGSRISLSAQLSAGSRRLRLR